VSTPTVSVVLPAFNRLKFLQAAVESVFSQTFADWELIIADDGSAQATAEYLASLTSRPRVRLLSLAHSGNPSAVRNAAVHVARGDYIAFLDSDDLWLPRKLEVQLRAQQAADGRRWSYTGLIRIDADGAVMPGETGRRSVPEGDIFKQLLTLEAAVATPSVIAERTLLAEVGGFDEDQLYFEEYELWFRLIGVSEVCGVDEPLVMVRSHEEHYSADRPRVYEARLRLLDRVSRAASAAGLQSTLRLERAKTLAALGAACAGSGQRARALRLLWSSRELAWHGRRWWSSSAAVARAFAPRWLRSAVRRARRWRRWVRWRTV
jgi:glycosyltransferase involved in cell wall biosynthesis